MEELGLIGNAAAVPVIIAVTQLLKKNFSFKYKSDVVSLVVSLILCPAWWLYSTPEVEIIATFSASNLDIFKSSVDIFLLSIATWLSAAKSYDLFLGNRKREHAKQVMVEEKEGLQAQVDHLEEPGQQENAPNEPKEDVEITDKLLEILEGRK